MSLFDFTKVTSLSSLSYSFISVETFDLSKYLTQENDAISKEQEVKYILKQYPILKAYTNLSAPISVIQYKKIEEEIQYKTGTDILRFHIMPQDLSRFENFVPDRDFHDEKMKKIINYGDVYLSEYEQVKKA